MRKLFLLTLFLLALLTPLRAQPVHKAEKIGVLDFIALRDNAKEVKDFTAQMQEKADKYAARKKQLEEEIKGLLETMQYLNEGSDEYSALREKVATRNVELQVIRNWTEKGVREEEVRFFENFFYRTLYACEEFAIENGYSMIFRLAPKRENVKAFAEAGIDTLVELEHVMDIGFDLYHSPDIDVTPQIGRLMDGRYGLQESFQRSRVTVYHDAWGAPQVFGADDEAAWYGCGLLHASLRMEGMMRNLMAARGELSRWFGEAHLESDRRAKMYRIDELAAEEWFRLPVVVTRPIEMFCLGVNDYIRERRKDLPDWVRNITPRDVVSFAILVQMRQAWTQIYQEEDPITATLVLVGGSKTRPFENLLWADVQTPATPEYDWLEAGLHGHSVNVYGAMLPGLPFVMIGHSDFVAWGFGGNRADTADIYDEQCNVNFTQYKSGSEWRPLLRREYSVEVKRADGTIGTVKEFCYDTEHGPVIRTAERKGFAARVARPGAGLLTGLYRINIAQSCVEVSNALVGEYFTRSQFVYGDILGNMAYLYSAAQPDRDDVLDWSQPVDGGSRLSMWGDYAAIIDLPNEYNPKSSYFISDNDAPWAVTIEADICASPKSGLVYDGELRSAFATQLENTIAKAKTMDFEAFRALCGEAGAPRRKLAGKRSTYSLLAHVSDAGCVSWSALRSPLLQDGDVTENIPAVWNAGGYKPNATSPSKLFLAHRVAEGQRITYGHQSMGCLVELRLRERHIVHFEQAALDTSPGVAPVSKQLKVAITGTAQGEARAHFSIPESEAGKEETLRVFYRNAEGRWMPVDSEWDKRGKRMSAAVPLAGAYVLGRVAE